MLKLGLSDSQAASLAQVRRDLAVYEKYYSLGAGLNARCLNPVVRDGQWLLINSSDGLIHGARLSAGHC